MKPYLRHRSSPVNLDGEIRMAKEANMRIADKKIRFFYPKGLTYCNECRMLNA